MALRDPVGLTRDVSAPDAARSDALASDALAYDAADSDAVDLLAPPVTEPVELGAGFPAVDREAWMRAVRGVLLKGKPDATDDDFARAYARQLVTATEDGFDLQPLYDADDIPAVVPAPGQAPYVRATHAAPQAWEIRQRVWADVEGSRAVDELESGATGVLLEVPADVDVDALDAVLDGVLLDLAPVSLATPGADAGLTAAAALVALWERRNTDPAARAGSLGVDPVGAWARSGGARDLAADLDAAAELVAATSGSSPAVRPLVTDGTVWHDAGATDGQELAWTIAAAAATVRALVEAGVALDAAFGAIEFRWAATADQFATIAKLRAARRLWARVAEIAGASDDAAKMVQHADASRAMLTRYDPWVNALRSTVACFAAAVGGADAVSVWPHDALVEHGGSPLGRRIARNTQTVLQLESNLARVVDMAGGSWYVEHRTDDVATAAWTELQRIEAAGGLVAAVGAGEVHAALTAVRERRRQALATRQRPLTGLTEFPDIGEAPPPVAVPGADTIDTAAMETAFEPAFEPFTLHRLADDFERQRGRTDAVERAGGNRPSVYLVTIGGPAVATARATFAKNLFDVAGIRTTQGDLEQYDAAVTPVVCLCSSDAVYREQAADVARRARAAGATTVFLAGRNLGIDGVDEEVGAGSDVLDFLTRTLDRMGVPA